jgi:hypothetical protein
MESTEIVERANQATRLLNDPTLVRAFEGVRQALLVKLEDIPLVDRDLQHEITVSLQLLKQLKRQLVTWVTDGQIEVARGKARELAERQHG